MSAICKEYCSWRSFDDMLELVTKSGASKTSSAISTWLLIGIDFNANQLALATAQLKKKYVPDSNSSLQRGQFVSNLSMVPSF